LTKLKLHTVICIALAIAVFVMAITMVIVK